MTSATSGALDNLALHMACPVCRVAAGAWCVTQRYERTFYLHGPRTEPVREAFALGYLAGTGEGPQL